MFEIKVENGHGETRASGTKSELITDAFQIFFTCCKTLCMSDDKCLDAYLKIIATMILTGEMEKIAQDQSGISDLKHTSISIEVPKSWYKNNSNNDTEGAENADD